MVGLLSKLLGRDKDRVSREATGLRQLAPGSRKQTGRREEPAQLDWSRAEYVPLPSSPPTSEVRGRDEFHPQYKDPTLGPIYQAGFKSQHTKVVKLAAGLAAEQRKGRVGEVIAKAYRKLIIQRMKAGQLAAAAEQCVEMFEMVSSHIQGVDQRRFNRILKQMDKAGKRHSYTPVDAPSPSSEPWLTVLDGTEWTVAGQRRLTSDELPNSAFDTASVDGSGMWLLDRSGSSSNNPEVRSVLRRLDRHGRLVGERTLSHVAYRTGAGHVGSSIAIMDSSGGLHIYDAALNVLTETDLQKDRRVVDHFRTIDTNYWGEFSSQVRAIDVSPEGDRYLFTLADEAWCCTMSGRSLWGVAMPLNEGWERVVARTERYGVAHEVESALRLFGLALPMNPTDIKRRYRELTRAHHPDRNPGDPAAEEKMKALNLAFEVLTGVDPNTLEFEESDSTYFMRTAPDLEFEVEGYRFEITMSLGTPQDWVYAASFAAAGGCAYVATYSGKVILLSAEGQPLVVYDIGTCPTEIAEIDRYVYFLTPTRLYIIEDRTRLAAIHDVFDLGRLLVSKSGFGLLTRKRLQWFTESGKKLGELQSRDPIRRVHKICGGAIVQTGQHHAEVRGPGL